MAQPNISGTQEVVGEEVLAQCWCEPIKGGGLVGALQRGLSKKDDHLAGPKGNVILAVTPTSLAIIEAERGLTDVKAGKLFEKIPKDQIAEFARKGIFGDKDVVLKHVDGREFAWQLDDDKDQWFAPLKRALGK